MEPKTHPVPFALADLWLIQGFVRHEMAQQDTWKFPPASLSLNSSIAEAILFCVDQNEPEAVIDLSLGDCLVFDYLIPNTLSDVDGKPVGREILLKTFRARRAIEDGTALTADASVDLTYSQASKKEF